jgi:hypothetical protein
MNSFQKALTTALAAGALSLVAIPVGAVSASAASYDPVTGMPVDGAGSSQPERPDPNPGIDPVTGMPIDGSTNPGDPDPGAGSTTITQGARVGTQVEIIVTTPDDGRSRVGIVDQRGHGFSGQPVGGTETFLVDAPFGKTRSYTVTVDRPESMTQERLEFALGGPKI